MSKLAIFVSATIVLIFHNPAAIAAPENVVPEVRPAPETAVDAPIDENMSLVEPEPVTTHPKFTPPAYYPYRQQLTFRAGASTAIPKIDVDDIVLGFQYLFPKFLSPKLEAGADLQKNGRGHLHAGFRWIFFERSYFRPSYKIAIDHFADSKEGLATLAEMENYYARIGATLEYVVWNPYSLRLEAELVGNFRYSELVPTLGLSRGW